MKKIVITALGKDRPGIVSGVTGMLYRHNASIEDSTMTILEGNFAMIMIVAVPKQCDFAALKKHCVNLGRKMNLTVSLSQPEREPLVGPVIHRGNPYIVSVLGSDKPGIVYKVSTYLTRHNINITDLNTKVIGREGDRNVYAMVLEVELPKKARPSIIERGLKQLARSIRVDLTFKAIESFNL
jgi:glycine cleavage system transcriptional repressor